VENAGDRWKIREDKGTDEDKGTKIRGQTKIRGR
jgi:hypothetical protein